MRSRSPSADVVARLASGFPTWSLPEADVSAGGRGPTAGPGEPDADRRPREEADSRALGAEDGLSRVDWLKAQAPALEGGQAPSLAPARR